MRRNSFSTTRRLISGVSDFAVATITRSLPSADLSLWSCAEKLRVAFAFDKDEVGTFFGEVFGNSVEQVEFLCHRLPRHAVRPVVFSFAFGASCRDGPAHRSVQPWHQRSLAVAPSCPAGRAKPATCRSKPRRQSYPRVDREFPCTERCALPLADGSGSSLP